MADIAPRGLDHASPIGGMAALEDNDRGGVVFDSSSSSYLGGDNDDNQYLLDCNDSSSNSDPTRNRIGSGVCQPCRKAKVRCDRHLPCARCVRLDLPCRPQLRGRGRLPTDGSKDKVLEMERAIYLQSMLRNPFVAQMFVRCATEMWVTAFNDLKITNKLDRNKTMLFLKALGLRILRYGNDACRSSLQLMSSLIQIDWERDLFTPDEMKNVVLAAERCEPSYLETEPRFRQLVNEWSDDGSAWSYAIAGKGQARISCNEKYVNTFLSGADEIDQINEEHLQPAFFWSRVLAPEDQPHFYTMVCDVACKAGMSSIGSQFTGKCIDKDGLEFMAKIRYRALFLERGKDVLVAFAITPLQNSPQDAYQFIPKSDIEQTVSTGKEEAASPDPYSGASQSPRAAPTIEEEDYQLPPSFHFCLSNSKRPREPTVHAPASTASSGSASCSSSTSNGSPKRAHMVVPPREPPTAQSPGQQIQMGPFAQQAMSSAKPEGPCTHSLPLPVPSPAPPTESHFATVTSLPQTLPYYGPYVPLQSFDFPTASMMPVPPMAPMVPMPSAQALAMDMEATRHWNSMRWVEGSAPPAPTPAPCTATTIPTPPVPRGPPRGPPQEHRRGANPDRSLLSDADLLELLFLDS